MSACPIRVCPFVRDMLAGLDTSVARGAGGMFTMKVPTAFSDADIEAAADGLHQNGRVCIYGLTHSGNRYAMPFVAMRVFVDKEAYFAYCRSEANTGVWVAIVLTLMVDALLWWLSASGPYFWTCLWLSFLPWLGVGLLIGQKVEKLRALQAPQSPEKGWIPYYDWN
jgi:hypothetical protein